MVLRLPKSGKPHFVWKIILNTLKRLQCFSGGHSVSWPNWFDWCSKFGRFFHSWEWESCPSLGYNLWGVVMVCSARLGVVVGGGRRGSWWCNKRCIEGPDMFAGCGNFPRLDFRRLPGPVFDPPRRETLSGDECGLIFPNSGWSAGSFSRTAAGNRA